MTTRPVIRCQSDVRLSFAPAGFIIASALVLAAKATGLAITITSGSENCGRLPTDPHMTGEAVDLGLGAYVVSDILALKAALELAFSQLTDAPFTVLYERPNAPLDARLAQIAYINPKATGPHIHIQRAKGTTYLPTTKVSA